MRHAHVLELERGRRSTPRRKNVTRMAGRNRGRMRARACAVGARSPARRATRERPRRTDPSAARDAQVLRSMRDRRSAATWRTCSTRRRRFRPGRDDLEELRALVRRLRHPRLHRRQPGVAKAGRDRVPPQRRGRHPPFEPRFKSVACADPEQRRCNRPHPALPHRRHAARRARRPSQSSSTRTSKPATGNFDVKGHMPMTDELLPYYNRELAFIRKMGAEFAAAHPKIAGRLRLGPDAGRGSARRAADRGVRVPQRPHPAQARRRLPGNHRRPARRAVPALPAPIPSMAVVQFEFGPKHAGTAGRIRHRSAARRS